MDKVNEKKEMTIDELAVMVQKGFLSVEEKIGNVRDELKAEFKSDLKNVKEELKAELNKKVDVFSHKELEFRVEKVEEKVGIAIKK